MAFMISKSKSSFSEPQKLNLSENARNESENINPVTSQLYLKSSSAAAHHGSETLDKDVVLRRIRHHKLMNKVRSAFQPLLAADDTVADTEQKWLQLGDTFSSP